MYSTTQAVRLAGFQASKRMLFALLFLVSLGDAWALSSSELIAILKARDQQFENASLTYTRYAKFSSKNSSPDYTISPGQPAPIPIEMMAKYSMRMTVRGDEVTVEQELDPSLFPRELKPGVSLPAAYSKLSNTEGKQRVILDSFPLSDKRRNKSLMIAPLNTAADGSQAQLFETKLAFGSGFGKYIKTIDHMETDTTGNLVLTGWMQLWSQDQSTFTLTLDSNYIVRNAVIHAKVSPVLNIISVATDGLAGPTELRFPKRGQFSHVKHSMGNGQTAGHNIVSEFSVEFKDIELRLSDQKYAQLTNMDVPDGTDIQDELNGVNYKQGQGASRSKP